MKRDASTLVLLGLALVVLARSSGAAATEQAKVPPRPTLNPRTGKPIVTPGTHRLTDDELHELIVQHSFANPDKAFAIAKRESGGYVDVVVDTRGMTADELRAYWGKPALPEYSVGLWQINVLANPQFDAESLKDPDEAAHAALELSDGGKSWGPWGG